MEIIESLDFRGALEGLLPQLKTAFVLVVIIAIASFAVALVLGLLIAIGRLGKFKILRVLLSALIEIIRGTPLLVQLVYMYYVVPLLLTLMVNLLGFDTQIQISAITAGIIGIGLNYGCLLSEVIRSAILSVDSGQKEAALALGMTRKQALYRIVLPQAMKFSIPVFGNYLATIVKDTSLLAYISVPEMLLETKTYSYQTLQTIESYTILAAAYLLISLPLSQIIKYMERRLSQSSGN